jgi:hypothetical protein
VNKEYYLKVVKRWRGSEEKKALLLEGGENGCSTITMLQCILPF